MGTNEGNNPVGNKKPETDYYHDKGATGTQVPELKDAMALSAQDDVISWDAMFHRPEAPIPQYQRDLIDAIPVKVVDEAEKLRKIVHIVSTVSINAGQCAEVLGKDATRSMVRLIETGGTSDCYLVSERTYNAYLGFPVVNLPDVMETEDALYVYNNHATDARTVAVYSEYVRSDASREERFYGSVVHGKREVK